MKWMWRKIQGGTLANSCLLIMGSIMLVILETTSFLVAVFDSQDSHVFNLAYFKNLRENSIHVLTIPVCTRLLTESLHSPLFASFKLNWIALLFDSVWRTLTKVDLFHVFWPTWKSHYNDNHPSRFWRDRNLSQQSKYIFWSVMHPTVTMDNQPPDKQQLWSCSN